MPPKKKAPKQAPKQGSKQPLKQTQKQPRPKPSTAGGEPIQEPKKQPRPKPLDATLSSPTPVPTGSGQLAVDRGAAVEKDEDTSGELVGPTLELLMPSSWPGILEDRFSMAVSRRAFDGWARQPSPCCAAASIAGAINAALGWGTQRDCALTHFEIAALLFAMLREQAERKRASLERLLGVASLGPAMNALHASLAQEGRSLGGRKAQGCSAKEAVAWITREALAREREAVMREMAREAAAGGGGGGEANTLPQEEDMWRALAAALQTRRMGEAEAEGADGGGDDGVHGDGAEEEGGGEEDEEDEELVAVVALSGSGSPEAVFARRVRRDLKQLVGKLAGAPPPGSSSPRFRDLAVPGSGI